MSETQEQVPREEKPRPQGGGTRRPPGPPRITGVDSPDEPDPFPLPPQDEVVITRRGKPIGVLTPGRTKQNGGQQDTRRDS